MTDNVIVLAGRLLDPSLEIKDLDPVTQGLQFSIGADGLFAVSDVQPIKYISADYNDITAEAKATFRKLNQTSNLELELPNDVFKGLKLMYELADVFDFEEQYPERSVIRVLFYHPDNDPIDGALH